MSKRSSAVLAVACFLAGGAISFAWTRDAGRAKNQDAGAAQAESPARGNKLDDDFQDRWEQLRAEYVSIAAPLLDDLDRVNRPVAPERTAVGDPVRTYKAEVAYQGAKLARESAEIELGGFTESVSKVEQQGAQETIDRATAAVKEAEDRLERNRSAREKLVASIAAKGKAAPTTELMMKVSIDNRLVVDEQMLARARKMLEQSKTRQSSLLQFDQKRRQLNLRADIEKKRAEELARLAEWEQAKAAEPSPAREIALPTLLPGERKVLVLLAETLRSPGAEPPWDGEPIEIQLFLDEFEAKLAEIRQIQAGTRKNIEASWYQRLTERLMGALLQIE